MSGVEPDPDESDLDPSGEDAGESGRASKPQGGDGANERPTKVEWQRRPSHRTRGRG